MKNQFTPRCEFTLPTPNEQLSIEYRYDFPGPVYPRLTDPVTGRGTIVHYVVVEVARIDGNIDALAHPYGPLANVNGRARANSPVTQRMFPLPSYDGDTVHCHTLEVECLADASRRFREAGH